MMMFDDGNQMGPLDTVMQGWSIYHKEEKEKKIQNHFFYNREHKDGLQIHQGTGWNMANEWFTIYYIFYHASSSWDG